MQIIPIASGKGGVGKSLIAANLSIALAQAGKKVIVVDLDLGASNLHIMLGMQVTADGIGSFLKGRKKSIKDVILDTRYSGLRFIPGDTEIPGLANLTAAEKHKLTGALKNLDCEFLVLDCGAGSGLNTVDFFLAGTRGCLVVMPTLTSALNAYLFLKNALFRILSQLIKRNSKADQFMRKLGKDGKPENAYNLLEILKKIQAADKKVYDAYRKKVGRFMPRLILNMLEDEKDSRYADRVRRSLHEYLGLEIEHLGIIYRDVLQDIALNSRIPIIVYKPHGMLAQAVQRIAGKILLHPDEEAGLVEIDTDETFQSAEIEAGIDFGEKGHSIEELMHSGELTQGDLLDIIKQQYIEVANLKKENQLLKKKLSRAVQEGFSP